ncbi:SH2 domain-containing protein 6 isoform X13 [Notamacropus eugenii]|uniref:SH2 domain-containing protein 6 isoform X13 n=1 Tax=Notamacropus eugenii TaxID=9315 RepID=UPI003B6719B8
MPAGRPETDPGISSASLPGSHTLPLTPGSLRLLGEEGETGSQFQAGNKAMGGKGKGGGPASPWKLLAPKPGGTPSRPAPLPAITEVIWDRSIIPGPPKPVPQPASLLSALSLQKAAGEGDRFGRKDLAASGSTDLAGEDDNEEAIYLEPSPASSTNQALGFQAPPPATMFPRPTITPRSAYKPASVCQETQSGTADMGYNAGRNPLTRNIPADEEASMLSQPWYSAHCDRHTVENALLQVQKDGTYTVRPSSDPQGWKPFTLAVFFHNHVYNIPIRWLDAKRQYALGRESKSYEKLFPNVAAMIQHFSEHPLLLVNRHTGDRHHTCLLFPTKSRLPQ